MLTLLVGLNCTLCSFHDFIFHVFLLSFFFSNPPLRPHSAPSCFFSQTSDGIPIHLKRGVPDRLLYRTTMALTVGGALYCLVALYIAAQPKK